MDDASTDNGPEIAADYANRDERIQLARHLVNSGLSAARNTGLRLAENSLICFLDSDDMLLPDSLSGRIAAFEPWLDDPAVAGVYSGIFSVPEDVDPQFVPPKRPVWDEFQDLITAGADCPFNAHAPLLKTSLLQQVGGFDESMRSGGEDWDLWQRLMRHGYYFRSAKLIGGLYRRKRNSMVRTLSTEHLEVATRLYKQAQQPLAARLSDPRIQAFDRPLREYLEAIPLSNRVIGFAAMSYADHGEAALRSHLTYLPDAAGPFLMRHIDLTSIIRVNLKRGLAVTTIPKGFEAEFAHMAEIIEAAVLGELNNRAKTPEVTERQYSALFLAGDAYEAQQVRNVAHERGLEELDILVLDPATVNGEQGVAAMLDSTDIRRCSVNELVFDRPKTPRVICFRDYGYGVDLLRAHAEWACAEFEIVQVAAPTVPDMDARPEELAPKQDISWKDLVCDRDDDGFTVLVKEELFERMPDVEKLESFRGIHAGERCVIVGNGPSLNEMDLSLLANEHTIAVNGIFYKTEETGFQPEYYVVEDSSVMKENIDAIIAYDVPYKFFPTHYQSLHPAEENVAFFRMNRGFYEHTGSNYCVPRFSTDFAQRAYCGQSVTYINLQLAYFMGFTEVYLIGMDFSYHIPDSAIRDGDLITSTEDDPNHFNGAYFGAGKNVERPKARSSTAELQEREKNVRSRW